MNVPRRHLTLLSLWILSLMCIYSEDSITFSPDRAPCVGDTIEMVCSIVPPASETFGSSVASVSINGSTPFTQFQLNTNSMLDGIDLSRYSANVNGLNPSTTLSVIRLIINSYLLTDSDTTFQCSTTFLNGTIFNSTMSDSPMTEAAISSFEGTTNITILSDCAIQISFSVTQITSNKLTDLNYTFTLRNEKGVMLDSEYNVTDSLTPSVTFSTTFTPDVCYGITVSVKNCPNGGEATASPTNFSLQGVNSSTGELQTSSTNSTRMEWKYKTDTCPNNYENLILTEDLFSFNLIKDNNTMYPITEFSLYLPDRFDFYIPPEVQSNEHSLKIRLCNQDLTQQDISITLFTATNNTVTIVLGVLVGLLIILFIVIVILIVLFLIFFYLKRNKNKK